MEVYYVLAFGGFQFLFTFAVVVLFALYFSNYHRWKKKRVAGVELFQESKLRFTEDTLLDPEIRENHVKWNAIQNKKLVELSQTKDALQCLVPVDVPGTPKVFLAFGYKLCQELSTDTENFASNPFPGNRLIALNTMTNARHDVVCPVLQKHYTGLRMKKLRDQFLDSFKHYLEEAKSNDGWVDLVPVMKLTHMRNTLLVLGLDDYSLVQPMVDYNDAAVLLMAPLGGIGKPPPVGFGAFMNLIFGLVKALPSTLKLIFDIGLMNAFSFLRPDLLLQPPSRPYDAIHHHPHLLHTVPSYFSHLNKLLNTATDGPLLGLQQAISSKHITRAEALVTFAQLMVNMTSANALCNLVHRMTTEKELLSLGSSTVLDIENLPTEKDEDFVREVLRIDAALMRNPRRVAKTIMRPEWIPGGTGVQTGNDGQIPEGSLILVSIGAANTDPTVFDEPDSFLLDRPASPAPITFGVGQRYCLGSHLVKTEMRVVLRYLLDIYGEIEIGETERVKNVDVGNYGFEKMECKLQRL